MRFDFHAHERTSPVRETTLARLWVLPAAVVLVFFLLYVAVNVLAPASTNQSQAYLLFRKNEKAGRGSVSLLWVNESKRELTSLQVPEALGFSSPTIGTYPISGAIAAYIQQHVPESVQETELSLFFRTRIARVITTTTGEQDISRTLLSLCGLRSPNMCILGIRTAIPGMFSRHTLQFPANILEAPDAAGIAKLRRDKYSNFLGAERLPSFGFEGQSVTLVNASGVTGVAKRAQTIFEDLGLSVLVVTDTTDLSDDGELLQSQPTKQTEELIAALARFFGVHVQTDTQLLEKYRTELVFFIGKKQASLFTP